MQIRVTLEIRLYAAMLLNKNAVDLFLRSRNPYRLKIYVPAYPHSTTWTTALGSASAVTRGANVNCRMYCGCNIAGYGERWDGDRTWYQQTCEIASFNPWPPRAPPWAYHFSSLTRWAGDGRSKQLFHSIHTVLIPSPLTPNIIHTTDAIWHYKSAFRNVILIARI
jgi:hypothetical protein